MKEAENLISFGLVGCGHIGKRHAELIKKYGKLTAVCDNDSKKSFQFAETYNAPSFINYSEFLENAEVTDVIVICTPNFLHAEQTIAALDNGFHVLCEKPMALNVQDCKKMYEAADRNQKSLLIVKQNRFNAPVMYLKELLDTQSLGKIYSISMNCLWNRNQTYYSSSDWKGRKELDGGILFTQFSHFFDIVSWLFGKSICNGALGLNFAHQGITEFEDTILALIKFDFGAFGSMHFSTNAYNTNMEGSLTVLAENGSITIGGEYLNKLTYHNVKGIDKPDLISISNANDYGYYTGSMNNHHRVYEYLIDALVQGKSLQKEVEASVFCIEIIQGIEQLLKKAMHNKSELN